MKTFIVNLNDCLERSQYEPFFYEHICADQLVLLDDPKDTCNLELTYQQVSEHINRRPFSFKKAAIFICIGRDFSKPLQAQDYELYNDINIYKHLRCRLSRNIQIYTLYVDRTGALQHNDDVYNRLRSASDTIEAPEECMSPFCLSLHPATKKGDYREYLRQQIESISPQMQEFYREVLSTMPELPDEDTAYQSGINHFVGECKKRLSGVNHLYAHIVRDDISLEIEEKLRVVYYLKALTDPAITPDNIPDYDHHPAPDYNHIRRLLATYRTRLSRWRGERCPIEKIAECKRYHFNSKIRVDEGFCSDVEILVNDQLQALHLDNIESIDVTEKVFEELDVIVNSAKEKLELFAYTQAQEIFDTTCYRAEVDSKFDLSVPPTEDELEERRQLEKLNHHSPHHLPGFSDENRLEQELEIKSSLIAQIFEKLKVYTKLSFLLTLLVGVLVIAGLYLWAQYSVFVKEHTWAIFGGYILVATVAFLLSYPLVRRHYRRQISALLQECKDLVKQYLDEFKLIAKEFEQNLIAAREYYCLKKRLDEKDTARREYDEAMIRYAWHIKTVDDILKNMNFFDHFINNAQPYDEDPATPEPFEHDAVHSQFYQLKLL